ncbi:type VI secretion system baseplate subunit TssF [Budvicia aquatica]|uniref:Type VI secretion system baseplate subunit TssF n=1 Tax=Budvicia aquatica TaxID=82979 RepID=A0A2C6DST0_9GAMM|nr:type VI secretion system baseplate subunit TssF [Budvicia aquatica]PHI31753.1 type VI secretion system baseplate subunit TssF [Budvicia aquatica]VFS52635.1 Uncharacterized protein conserved in bacteria [Budvicia aquatica]
MELKELYRDELSHLKLLAQDFVEEYPDLESFLSSSAADPDVERLLEGSAFLTARLRKKIEDGFPEITHGLLEEVWPTPLRPIPATTIVEFFPDDNGEMLVVPKGTHIKGIVDSKPDEYLFKVQREVEVLPLELVDRKMAHSNDGSQITLTFRWNGKSDEHEWQPSSFTLFLGKNHATAGLLQLWLSHYLKDVKIQSNDQTYTAPLDSVALMKPDADTLALPIEIKQYWRLQLLQEYFYTPHVNDFVHLDLSKAIRKLPLNDEGVFQVTFNFNRIFPFEYAIDEQVFKLHCVPAINLFNELSSSIQFVTGKQSHTRYPLNPANRDHRIFQILSMYSPADASDNNRGMIQEYRAITNFVPTRFTQEHDAYFYKLELENDVRESPVHRVSFFDHEGKSVEITDRNYFICELECDDGERVMCLNEGDICEPTSEVPSGLSFRNITTLTKPQAPLPSSHRHWPLISHLSLSPMFLNDKKAIQQVILDFDIHMDANRPANDKHRRYLAGIEQVSSMPIDRLFNGLPVRGLKMKLHLNPDFYPDLGEAYRFGSLLTQFFAYCITDNSFLFTDIFNTQTNECWTLPQITGTRGQI